jgi:hypothetical protein
MQWRQDRDFDMPHHESGAPTDGYEATRLPRRRSRGVGGGSDLPDHAEAAQQAALTLH